VIAGTLEMLPSHSSLNACFSLCVIQSKRCCCCCLLSAHVKTSLMGVSLNVPITDGKLKLGTWQGIWLCEHRDHGSSRKIVVTLQGVQ
jgi:hypothetical protein